ncbi:hypothetical protein DPQ22_08600 [Candidatus Tokpelaia sp.]|nr:hypothetical protein DPQ22_08600 [Candidatus Tokpelaia sp.]
MRLTNMSRCRGIGAICCGGSAGLIKPGGAVTGRAAFSVYPTSAKSACLRLAVYENRPSGGLIMPFSGPEQPLYFFKTDSLYISAKASILRQKNREQNYGRESRKKSFQKFRRSFA